MLIHIVFALLMIGTFVFAGVWYYFDSLENQAYDQPVGYVVGFMYVCYFGFFMLIAEGVLWKNTVYFASSASHIAIEKIGRILLLVLSFAELIGAVYALCFPDSDLELIDLLTATMLLISAVQILCQCTIWIGKWVAKRKQSVKG